MNLGLRLPAVSAVVNAAHNRSIHCVNGRRTLVPFGSRTWEESLPPLTAVLSAGADFLPILVARECLDSTDQVPGSLRVGHDSNVVSDSIQPATSSASDRCVANVPLRMSLRKSTSSRYADFVGTG